MASAGARARPCSGGRPERSPSGRPPHLRVVSPFQHFLDHRVRQVATSTRRSTPSRKRDTVKFSIVLFPGGYRDTTRPVSADQRLCRRNGVADRSHSSGLRVRAGLAHGWEHRGDSSLVQLALPRGGVRRGERQLPGRERYRQSERAVYLRGGRPPGTRRLPEPGRSRRPGRSVLGGGRCLSRRVGTGAEHRSWAGWFGTTAARWTR